MKKKMAVKNFSFLVLILFLNSKVESASLLERPYEFIMSYLGRNLAPSLYTFLDCFGDEDAWNCAKTKAGALFDKWDEDLQHQRRIWQEAADSEVSTSGRSIEEMPSKIGREVENSLVSLADMVQHGMARALSRKHHDDSGGIDTITISTGSGGKKKKEKKKKQKPPKIHLVQPVMMQMEPKEDETRAFSSKAQTWVIGGVRALDQSANATPSVRQARGILSEMWSMGEKAIDAVSEHAVMNDDAEDGIVDKSSDQEQRGKKKKKKKAILKLLVLGAVLKAKIGTLLQILSFKLQVKFFLIALIGLAINLARFWIDLKNKHHQQPQKVIYYEHAQHQHHYDHEEEPAWGPWSRSMDPPQEQTDAEIEFDVQNIPYRAQIDRNAHAHAYTRPVIKRV